MSILLFVNLKGGVAKTTNAVAVAECLADAGHRTLLIDADHQCMAGELLLGESRLLKLDNQRKTLHDLMLAMLHAEFTVEHLPYYVVNKVSNIGGGLPNLSVIPCSIRIDDLPTFVAKAQRRYKTNEEFLAMFRGRRQALGKWLNARYDFIIVDCPPSVPVQVKTFLSISDAFVVPAIPDRLSVRGSLYLLDRIRRLNLKANGLGLLWSLYRVQNPVHRKLVESATSRVVPFDLLPAPFETVIPNAAAIVEAMEPGQTPKSFKAKYTPVFAKLYSDLSEEIVRRSQWQAAKVSGEMVEVAG